MVGCYECHQAKKGDIDAYEHGGEFNSNIVSPKDCSRCNCKEVVDLSVSLHTKAGTILGSLNNFLAKIIEGDREYYGGSALTVSGYIQRHGSLVGEYYDGSLTADTWSNSEFARFSSGL